MSEPSKNNPNQDIRSHLKKTVLGLLLFCLLMIAAGSLFSGEIELIADKIYNLFGIWGLVIFLCINDTIISPIPPDVVLVVLSHSPKADQWLPWVLCFGCASSFAGILGWLLGKRLRKTRLPAWLFGTKLENGEKLMKRYGMLSVAIGALTPVPYSLTTWSAGILNAPFSMVFLPSLLRILRFLVYYVMLKGAFTLSFAMQHTLP